MANPPIGSPTAGGPPGMSVAGPLHFTTSRGSTPYPTGISCLGPWVVADLATGSASTVAMLVGANASSHLAFPKAGSLVGMSVDQTAKFTANGPVIKSRIAGVDAISLGGTTGITTETSFTTNLRTYPISAGDSLQVVYNRITNTAPDGSVDVGVYLWVS